MSQPRLTLKLAGEAALIRKLNALDGRLRGTIARKALRAGAAPVIAAERQTVPVDTGNLRHSITKKIRTKGGRSYAVIGPSIPEGAHAHFTESGTDERVQEKTGRRTGRVVGIRWMERAFDSSSGEAAEEMINKLRQGVKGA